MAGGVVVAAAPSSLAFATVDMFGAMTTLAGDCSAPTDQDSLQSAPGATEFGGTITSSQGGMEATSVQKTRVLQTGAYVTVQSTGQAVATGTSDGTPSCHPAARVLSNEFNVSVSSDGPITYRVRGSVRATGSGKTEGAFGGGCGSVGTHNFSKSACFPPDSNDPKSLSFNRSGELGGDSDVDAASSISVGLRSGVGVGIAPEGGAGRATVRWDITMTVTPKPQEIACGEAITKSITLNKDLDCTGHGLIVAFPNIAIDLGGHRISGDTDFGDHGIDNSAGHRGVRVKNGRIDGFDNALFLNGARTNTLSQMQVSNNTTDGVKLEDSVGNTVRNVRSEANGVSGVAIAGGGENVVKENKTHGNEANGIALVNTIDNRVIDNRANTNGQAGLLLDTAALNFVKDNRFTFNVSAGVKLDGSGSNTIKQNRAKESPVGFQLLASEENALASNDAIDDGIGFDVETSNTNGFQANLASGADEVGYRVASGDLNSFRANRAVQNTLDGFRIETNATNTDLFDNVSNANQGFGYRVLNDTTTGSANTGSNNVLGLCDSPPNAALCQQLTGP
jgi:parallel beta-helix repeat protein